MDFLEALKKVRNKGIRCYAEGVMVTPIIRWDIPSRSFRIKSIRVDTGETVQKEQELIVTEQLIDYEWVEEDIVQNKERVEIINEMKKKDWNIDDEKRYQNGYIQLTFGKYL